jgi:hypothetical protein
MKLEATFTLERETKNTYRYQEELSSSGKPPGHWDPLHPEVGGRLPSAKEDQDHSGDRGRELSLLARACEAFLDQAHRREHLGREAGAV